MTAIASFDLDARVALVTGGYGVLGGSIAAGLAAANARVAVLGRNKKSAEAQVAQLRASGADAIALAADVLDEQQLRHACDQLLSHWGRIDILINAAGGNISEARTDNKSVFEMPMTAFNEVVTLNLHGSLLPMLVFGKIMADQKSGSIINISSMAAQQAISGVLGYSAAKAAVDNVTRWMAVELARRYGTGVRVNAVAPGFFVSAQNRRVLINDDGSYTARARDIIGRTPMGRFGNPEELNGAVQWLCSDAASFVTGVVIPVDGGFSAFSGI